MGLLVVLQWSKNFRQIKEMEVKIGISGVGGEEESNQTRNSDPYVLHRHIDKKDNKRVEKSKE